MGKSGRHSHFVVLGLLVGSLLSPALCGAQKRGPSTAKERAKAVQLARKLESDPLAKDAREERNWLVKWIEEVPDISVKICPELFPPLLESPRKNYAQEILGQTTFSEAAFIIEHPENAKNDLAVYTAGVEGALKAYQALLKAKPDGRWPFLDDLIEQQKSDELKDYIRRTVEERCTPEDWSDRPRA